MNDPILRQRSFNAESRDQWEGFSDHRRNVSALLGAGSAPGSSRLCVLGAGNGNDLDLPSLLQAHREVHLVDLDAEALARGATRQGMADHPSLRCHGGLDLTGMLDVMAGWSPHAPIPDADLTAMVEWPSHRVGMALPSPFHLVASTCLLSQMIGTAFHQVGEHPRFLDAARAIRLGHLRLLAHLLAPGGTALLITDVVSSRKYPALESLAESSLSDLLPRLALADHFINGVNPAEILATVRRDPVLASRVIVSGVSVPWRWRLHDRVYLVWAMRMRVESRRSR